ncbi:uncharacterized protein LOC108205273 isoform X1 [Daucus carota subsp. sativus]|uniref:uncharacterized protein LOC108205273 isoform X1 n=1 Tax=Daucus carota subsp. sativus TaxID=79200 RepID=UPI0007EF1EA6|nr:PREDICTED: uncharacterized protein LOC108205273 isoform X1 [Daucus carota subsp. sativus]
MDDFWLVIVLLSYMCLTAMVASTKSPGILVHFNQVPPYHSRFSSAIFKYSVIRLNSSYPCSMNDCSFICEVDGHSLVSCPADVVVLKNLTVNHWHQFGLNVTTAYGETTSSTYKWFIDTIPPTATIYGDQKYTNAEKVALELTFSEACTGNGGFKCLNSSHCDVIVSGPAHVDASSLHIVKHNIKYRFDVILSLKVTYELIVIKTANHFCTDRAGNNFTRTGGSVFTLHLDRRAVQVDLWTSAPSYELEFDGIPRTVTATNRMEELKFFLDFSTPITNSTEQILNALHPNSGVIVPIHSRGHGNRSFAFVLKNLSRTEIITIELEDGSVLGRTGTPVSPVAPLTLLYDSTEPSVWLTTSSEGVTKDPYINLLIHFTKPIFGFEASTVEAQGGTVIRFEEISKALYSSTVLAESQNVSVIVPAGKVSDISGNHNSVSNQLKVKHSYTDSAHSTPVLLHSFMSVGIVVTSVAAAFISFSSTNLAAVGALASGRKSMEFYEPCTNLHGIVGHLQVFALSDCLSLTLPVEYSATTKGLRWLIPRQKLPWTKDHSEHGYSHSYQAVARHTRKSGDSTIKLHAGEEMEHSLDLHPTNFSKSLHQGLPLPVNIYPKSNRPVTHQNVTIKNTPYGLTLSSDEYYTYFLREEPMSANTVLKRLERYTGWQDLEMNLFWLGVGGGGLITIHCLVLLLVRWRFQTSVNEILSVLRFEFIFIILSIPCVSQSSAFVIKGGTAGGILTGAMLLVIPGGLILLASFFIVIVIFPGNFVQYKEVRYTDRNRNRMTNLWQLFTGKASTGKWFYRERLPSSIIQRFGIIFENTKGPPIYIVIDQNDPNQMPRWTESGQNGIGRMRALSSDDGIEETIASVSTRLLGCLRSSYVILDLTRRVALGILSGVHSSRGTNQNLYALIITLVQVLFLFTLKPHIRRVVHVVETISLLCEAGVFGLAIITSRTDAGDKSTVGYIMLAFFCIAFISQIINQWYTIIKSLLKFSQPQQDSFRAGLKLAIKGLLLPLLPRKCWSRFLPGSKADHELRDTRPHNVNPLGAMTAMVAPVLSPGPPGLSLDPVMNFGDSENLNTNGDQNRLKGILHFERKNEMKRLRELAKASFSGGSKFEDGTSYGFRS